VSHRRGVQKNYARTAARNLEVWQKRGRSARACGFLRRVDAFVMPLYHLQNREAIGKGALPVGWGATDDFSLLGNPVMT
jgi:hypothetical protein